MKEVRENMAPDDDETHRFSAVDFRKCLGEFVTGVTVITTVGQDGVSYGTTVNSFTSLSLDPPLVLWCMRLNASAFPIYSNATRVGINILAEDQLDISNRFAKSGVDRFKDVETRRGSGGVPLIEGCVAQLECQYEHTYPGGDHVVFVCRVEKIHSFPRKPLALGRGKYSSVLELKPAACN
ncbi:MAG TPA: flavin reductase family protein [Ramlibacter sp.]|nr:flavin reductase family protein [Ramlibacter sp.]